MGSTTEFQSVESTQLGATIATGKQWPIDSSATPEQIAQARKALDGINLAEMHNQAVPMTAPAEVIEPGIGHTKTAQEIGADLHRAGVTLDTDFER